MAYRAPYRDHSAGLFLSPRAAGIQEPAFYRRWAKILGTAQLSNPEAPIRPRHSQGLLFYLTRSLFLLCIFPASATWARFTATMAMSELSTNFDGGEEIEANSRQIWMCRTVLITTEHHANKTNQDLNSGGDEG